MRHVVATSTLLLALGCGDSSHTESEPINHVESPTPHAGGGIGSGAIYGELNVFVIDDRTEEFLTGADVRIGAADAKAPLLGTTDANGRVIFREQRGEEKEIGVVQVELGALDGPQVVTATAGEDYAATTWIGVNGAVVTIPLEPTAPAEPEEFDTATVSGTITDWDTLPDPAAGRLLVGFVNYSATEDLGEDPQNAIEQVPHPNPNLGDNGVTQNMCVRVVPLIDECDWTLTTRVGEQALYAVILSIDPMAADGDAEILGYAFRRGLDVDADDTLAGQDLEIIPDGDLIEAEINFADAPGGLDTVVWYGALDLGAEGQIVFSPPEGLNTVKIPDPAGVLEGTYDVVGTAVADPDDETPVSRIFAYDVDMDGAVDLGEWLAVADDLAQDVATRTYTFARVEGASAHALELDDTDGEHEWNVAVFDVPAEDGTTADGGAGAGLATTITVTLPALDPDPLPEDGNLDMSAIAFDIPGFDPLSFELEPLIETIARLSADKDRFSLE